MFRVTPSSRRRSKRLNLTIPSPKERSCITQGVTVEFDIPSGETVENSDFDNVVDSALNDDGSDGLGQLSNYVQDDDEDESADLDIDGVEV